MTSSWTLTLEVLMSFPPSRGPCGDDPDARVAVSALAHEREARIERSGSVASPSSGRGPLEHLNRDSDSRLRSPSATDQPTPKTVRRGVPASPMPVQRQHIRDRCRLALSAGPGHPATRSPGSHLGRRPAQRPLSRSPRSCSRCRDARWCSARWQPTARCQVVSRMQRSSAGVP